MRLRARIDANQGDIVDALRKAGASVDTEQAKLGKGRPDLLVGFRGKTFGMEVKVDGGKLTDDQVAYALNWKGHYVVVHTPEEALAVIGL